MVTTVRLLHSRTRRIGETLIQCIYKDGSNVFVELWRRGRFGSLQLESMETFPNGLTITLPCLVGRIVEAGKK